MQSDFLNKCKILGAIWIDHSEDPAFNEFIRFNDLGLPLAYAYSQDMIEIHANGLRYVEESWNQLVEHPNFDLHDFDEPEEED